MRKVQVSLTLNYFLPQNKLRSLKKSLYVLKYCAFIFVPDLKTKCNIAVQPHTNQQTFVNST